ncbi:hypothetical protein Patl1_23992 [Pistacia atlantica]|uniref:Uncharacterized protein n=1 Tax=Pistacia atlantica TaxID=434234 RepID=A0ACC0ZZ50_9ROSI|nr:hypothetical protein Patl1_23992 [Pistacia atlantica]
MVDEAQKALEEAEPLKKFLVLSTPTVFQADQKLHVCDNYWSIYDSDHRLADHFGGKLHLGYMQIRDKLAELQVMLPYNGQSFP